MHKCLKCSGNHPALFCPAKGLRPISSYCSSFQHWQPSPSTPLALGHAIRPYGARYKQPSQQVPSAASRSYQPRRFMGPRVNTN